MEKVSEEQIKKYTEEFEKYMGEEKEKKIYSVSLTKENVEYIKEKLNVPFSKVVNDFIGMMALSFKKFEEAKKQQAIQDAEKKLEEKKLEDKKSETEKKED
ncbi:MAG: hypothetical protein OQK82_01905 [Candidatus Pacearchaeota archaeon]|nr:hypothetical protein [Candidatus Pacearchaeota archaeon]